jgi:hypothetical protein
LRVVEPLVLDTEYAKVRHKAVEKAEKLRTLVMRSVLPRVIKEAGTTLEACKRVLMRNLSHYQ